MSEKKEMTREEAIEILQEKHDECKSFYDLAAYPEISYPETGKYMLALRVAIAALSPQNEPLTLEQLREMDGEPVWVVVSQNWRESGIKSGWRLVKFHINDDRIRLYMFDTHFGASFFAEQDMGRSYWVYRRPPEGEGNA